jgi:uncharacterized protein with GYD domain
MSQSASKRRELLLVVFAASTNGDDVAKFALSLSSQGNVRTRTSRAWSEPEFLKLLSELP